MRIDREFRDSIKCNICIIGIQEEEEREGGLENIFEEIIGNNRGKLS